jgi:hypothetical protein
MFGAEMSKIETTIEQFAERYRVKRLPAGRPSKRCGNRPIEVTEDVVEGKVGFIGEGWGDGRMILHILAVPRDADMNGKLNRRFRMAEEAGMTLKVKSGYESEWYFDPTNERQALAAIECVQPKRMRTVTLTPEQRAAIGARLHSARTTSPAATVPIPVS